MAIQGNASILTSYAITIIYFWLQPYFGNFLCDLIVKILIQCFNQPCQFNTIILWLLESIFSGPIICLITMIFWWFILERLHRRRLQHTIITFRILPGYNFLNPHSSNTIVCITLWYYPATCSIPPKTFCVPPGAQVPQVEKPCPEPLQLGMFQG